MVTLSQNFSLHYFYKDPFPKLGAIHKFTGKLNADLFFGGFILQAAKMPNRKYFESKIHKNKSCVCDVLLFYATMPCI